MKRTVDKWNLDRDVRLNHKVIGAKWLEDRAQWEVTVQRQDTEMVEYADILISGQGFLKYVFLANCVWFNEAALIWSSTWRWPSIEGIHDFQGHKVHSAAWDHSYDYSYKRIAVIGNGSSGIQILPKMAQLPGTTVTSFQRGPTYVVNRLSPGTLLGKDDPAYNPEYTEEEKKRFSEDKKYHNQYRKKIIHGINKGFRMVSEALFGVDKPKLTDCLRSSLLRTLRRT